MSVSIKNFSSTVSQTFNRCSTGFNKICENKEELKKKALLTAAVAFGVGLFAAIIGASVVLTLAISAFVAIGVFVKMCHNSGTTPEVDVQIKKVEQPDCTEETPDGDNDEDSKAGGNSCTLPKHVVSKDEIIKAKLSQTAPAKLGVF